MEAQADCRLFSSIGLIGLRERGDLLHRGSPHLGEAYHGEGLGSALDPRSGRVARGLLLTHSVQRPLECSPERLDFVSLE
jgi:hypothetical protein